MFEELTTLSYEDLIAVGHGIFAVWGGSPGVLYTLTEDQRGIAETFVDKYPEAEYGKPLSEYMDKRIYEESPPSADSQATAERFLTRIAEDFNARGFRAGLNFSANSFKPIVASNMSDKNMNKNVRIEVKRGIGVYAKVYSNSRHSNVKCIGVTGTGSK